MSPDPRPLGDDHGAPPPRRGSGWVARLFTGLYALVITPLATGLLAYGGMAWLRILSTAGFGDDSMTDLLFGPMGLTILGGVGLGTLLLASVVATGIASSAGLLVAGLLGLFSLVLSAVPGLLFGMYEAMPSFIPPETLDGLAYGLPLIIHTLMGGLGMALVIARRRPDPHLAASLIGLLVVPVVLFLGAGLQFGGLGRGVLHLMRSFDSQISPLAVVLIVLGSLLLWLGAAASRWSPYALLIPALALIVVTVLLVVPTVPLPEVIWSHPTANGAASFLLIGGGVATAVILLVQTAVQAVVRRRARQRLRAREAFVPHAS